MTAMANSTYYEQLDTLDAVERELYRILKTFINNTTKKCFPSIRTLEIKLKRCRKTTKKYLKILESKGFIHIQERKVKHKVTNNKHNETNMYTLLLEKFNGFIEKNDDKQESKVIELEETDLDRITRELEATYNKESVISALKAMRKNIRNGSIVYNMKSYLESLINKSSNQLEQVNKVLESSKKTSNSTSYTKHQANNYNNTNNKNKTKFHNFEQRTSNYTKGELNDKIRSISKAKIDTLLNR